MLSVECGSPDPLSPRRDYTELGSGQRFSPINRQGPLDHQDDLDAWQRQLVNFAGRRKPTTKGILARDDWADRTPRMLGGGWTIAGAVARCKPIPDPIVAVVSSRQRAVHSPGATAAQRRRSNHIKLNVKVVELSILHNISGAQLAGRPPRTVSAVGAIGIAPSWRSPKLVVGKGLIMISIRTTSNLSPHTPHTSHNRSVFQ